ncbi:MAG: radical SAM protein [Pseudomonadota bacterium]
MTSALPELLNHVVTGSPVSDLVLDGTKVMWWRERVEAWERGEKIAPVTMDVAFTRRCAAACNFCYASMQSSDGGEITREIAFQFLEDAAEIGVKGISLISDGESTEVDYYADSIEHGGKLGLQLGISTNGMKLTRPIMEQILPHLSYLRFNFSGGDKKRWSEIMGVKQVWYEKVIETVKTAMEIKRRDNLPVTINLQFVVMPTDADQIVPFAKLAKEIRPDYAILKHCADNKDGTLGVDYANYKDIFPLFQEAEAMSDDGFRVVVKWSRLEDEGKRHYTRCFGPPFITQMSGNGLIAPCGFLFNEKYKAFHVGNITRTRFRDIFASDRYWEVMNYLASEFFNPQLRCGPNCLQTNTNQWLFDYKEGKVSFPETTAAAPAHLGFL